jgi:hypothetical protein
VLYTPFLNISLTFREWVAQEGSALYLLESGARYLSEPGCYTGETLVVLAGRFLSPESGPLGVFPSRLRGAIQ